MNKTINLKLNEQEKFWLGSFGNNYIHRNNSKKLKKNTDVFFKKIFQGKKVKISNIIELGANIGNNIDSLAKIFKKSLAHFFKIFISAQIHVIIIYVSIY